MNNEDRGDIHHSSEGVNQQHVGALGAHFIHFLQDSNDVIICKDEEGMVTFWNKGAENLYGYKAADVLGKSINIIAPKDHDEHKRLIAELKGKTQLKEFTTQRRKKNGTTIDVSIDAYTIEDKDGNTIGYSTVTRIIGAETLKTIKSLTDKLPFGYMMMRFDQVSDLESIEIVDVSPVSEKMNGVPPDDIIGKKLKEAFPALFEDHIDLVATYQRAVIANKSIVVGDIEYEGDQGLKGVFRLSVHPLVNNFFFILYENVTEDRRLKADLNMALAVLKEQNAELNQFAYVASHDLQEPLRVISSYLQLIKGRYSDMLDEKGNDFIDRTVKASNRMKTLITDLLRLSRISHDESDHTEIELNEIIDELKSDLSASINENSVTIKHENLGQIIGVKTQIKQLFQNLIQNAIKFSDESRDCEIAINYEKNREHIVVSVEDNGIGIEEQYFERIFTIFQRLHNRDEYQGTGIGLALCKKIMNKHSGHIKVDSTVGVGTKFTLQFPNNK